MIYILKNNFNEENQTLMKKFSIMKWYPISQVICMLPATINRIYTLITNKHQFAMSLLQAIFDSILGVVICIIFLLSPEIKHSLIICFKILFNKKFNNNKQMVYNSNNNDSLLEKDFSDDYSYEISKLSIRGNKA